MVHNTMGQWILFLIIGATIGWVAGVMIRGRGFGIIVDVAIGVVGAILGGWMAGVVGLSTDSLIDALLMAFTGAVVLVIIARFVARRVRS